MSVCCLSYNVRYDEPADGADAWAGRRDAVASTIRFHDPDLVGLQEPLPEQLADLSDRLPAFDWYGRPRGDGERQGEHVPIGVRSDRFAVEEADTFWLSDTPDLPGSVGWDAAHPRIATWVRVRDRTTGARFVHANTHLDHAGERARLEGARVVCRRVAEVADGRPVVLTGDFNCTAADPPYRAVVDDEAEWSFRDAGEASQSGHHGPETTRTDFASLVPERTIDHLFVTPGLTVRDHGVCTDLRANGRYPSDHLPVLARFERGELTPDPSA